MRRIRAFAATVCLAALALGGCGLNPSGSGTGTTLRVANLMPGTTAVTVTVGDAAFMTAAPFETFTGYQDISAGSYAFNILLGGSATPAFTTTNVLANVSAYTFIPYGPTTLTEGLLLDDTPLAHIPTGNFGFRFANVSPTAGLIDAYVTAPGADLASASPVVSSLPYNSFSTFVNVPLGTYELRITRSGTKEVIFDAPLPAAQNSLTQTVVAYTRGSARLVNVALFTDGSPPTTLPNRYARLKAVNASSVASPLNLFVDGSLTLANIPYTGVANYQVIDAGTRALAVEASATPGAPLLSTSTTFTPATDTSIALYGSAGALAALILTDANVSSLTAKAEIRFVNVAPALGSVDVYANGTLATAGVAQNSASPYVLLDAVAAGTTYQFDFDAAGTTTPVLSVPGISLTAGGVYTIYVVGPPGALQGILVQDF